MLGLHKLHLTTCQASDMINIFALVKIWLWLRPCFEFLAFLCANLLNNFLYLCWCVVVLNLLAFGELWRCQLKLHCLTHFRGLSKLPNVAYNAFWLILKWLFSKCLYSTFLCVFTMYNTKWAKTRRALDCVFTIMAEILGRYWQILDRSGKKIILLSPLAVRNTFLVLNIHKVTMICSLFLANCADATTHKFTQLQNHLVLFWKRDSSDIYLHFLALLISYNY